MGHATKTASLFNKVKQVAHLAKIRKMGIKLHNDYSLTEFAQTVAEIPYKLFW